MYLEYDLPKELININPSNIIFYSDLNLYKVEYEYYTNRNNKKSFQKYIIYPASLLRDATDSYSSAICCLSLNNLIKNHIDDSLITTVIKPFFINWVNNFNEKYSFRKLNSVEITNVKKECLLNWKIHKNKLFLELPSFYEDLINNSNKPLFIYSNLEVWKANVSYTTTKRNSKSKERYFLKEKSIQFLEDIYLRNPSSLEDFVKSYYNRINFQSKYIDKKQNKITSNVKILDAMIIDNINLC